MLVKASVAGAIVANTLFMLGASFLLGGMKYHLQEYNRVNARFQAGLLFLATVALLIPSAVGEADSATCRCGISWLQARWENTEWRPERDKDGACGESPS
jgi:calcium/proton exchanger cax